MDYRPPRPKAPPRCASLRLSLKASSLSPATSQKIEADLKKEWTKREREAKQALKKQSEAAAPSKASRKRKADDGPQPGTNINISLNLTVGAGGNVSFSSASSAPAAKKAKTVKAEPAAKKVKAEPAAAKAKAPAKAKASNTKATAPKPTATSYSWTPSKDAAPVFAAPPSSAAASPQLTSLYSWTPKRESPPPRTVRGPASGGLFHPAGISDRRPKYPNTGAPRPEPGFDPVFDNPPPPYPGSEDEITRGLLPLGILNGQYTIYFDEGCEMDSSLVLTLDGNVLWGSFDVGGFLRGIIRLNERPYKSSYEMLAVDWRGENDLRGYRRYGDEEADGSFLRFTGDGRIEGMIGDGQGLLKFDGERLSGQETRSEISAWNMRRQWVEGPDIHALG